MYKTITTSKLALSAVALAVLVGCASNTGSQAKTAAAKPAVNLQAPETTPYEKWSDAMLVLRGDMNIYGQHDIPAGEVQKAAAANGQGLGSAAADLGVAYGGFRAPPTGVSPGAALGIGMAFALIPTGQLVQPWQLSQTAAWVPTTLASNMDEAVKVAEESMNAARSKVYADPTSIKSSASKYPDGHSRQYKSFTDVLTDKATLPEGEATAAPSFLPAGSYYGPIFFNGFGQQHYMDGHRSDLSPQESNQRLSQALPAWFTIYDPGRPERKDQVGFPPVVMVSGTPHFFIGK